MQLAEAREVSNCPGSWSETSAGPSLACGIRRPAVMNRSGLGCTRQSCGERMETGRRKELLERVAVEGRARPTILGSSA